MSLVAESIEYNISIHNIPLLHTVTIPTSFLMTLFVWLAISVISVLAAKGAKLIPRGLQNAVEVCFEAIFKMADESIGEEAHYYYPLFIGIFIYIMAANLLGLVPGFSSPTSDLNTTISLSLIVFVYYNMQGFRKHGIGYLGHFFGPPLPWYMSPIRLLMFFIEMIGNFARPFSLALRLFCNIFSKEMLLSLLAVILVQFFTGHTMIEKGLTVAPLVLRPFIILLGMMIGLIQALIFLTLSVAYVAGAVKTEEGH